MRCLALRCSHSNAADPLRSAASPSLPRTLRSLALLPLRSKAAKTLRSLARQCTSHHSQGHPLLPLPPLLCAAIPARANHIPALQPNGCPSFALPPWQCDAILCSPVPTIPCIPANALHSKTGLGRPFLTCPCYSARSTAITPVIPPPARAISISTAASRRGWNSLIHSVL